MQTSANGHSRADWPQSIAGQWYLLSLARGLEEEKGDSRPHFAGQFYLWSQRNRPSLINLHHWPQHASDSSGCWPGIGKNNWPSDSGHISQLMWQCLDWVCSHSGQPTSCFISLSVQPQEISFLFPCFEASLTADVYDRVITKHCWYSGACNKNTSLEMNTTNGLENRCNVWEIHAPPTPNPPPKKVLKVKDSRKLNSNGLRNEWLL